MANDIAVVRTFHLKEGDKLKVEYKTEHYEAPCSVHAKECQSIQFINTGAATVYIDKLIPLRGVTVLNPTPGTYSFTNSITCEITNRFDLSL